MKDLYLSLMRKRVVYYESMKRKLKTRPLYECRCDERLKTKFEESTRLACTVLQPPALFQFYHRETKSGSTVSETVGETDIDNRTHATSERMSAKG